ncbi:MAG: lysophospholipid acyltransferase family protein [Candidatus Paceibacterota bacterium]|jgi:1-acyl-sn-glycerol-3-phosphate acyltransferase
MATILDNTADAFELFTPRDLLWKERVVNSFARFTQYITWPFLFLLFHSFFNIQIKGRHNFDLVKSPFIILAHHVSFYDSFIFRLILGPFTEHLPLRFMAVTKFNGKFLNNLATIGVVDFVYSLFGVFTVIPGLGIDKNLKKAKEIIKVGGNIVIYPEGKINDTEVIGKFKLGAATLIKETGVSMIPVSFRLGSRGWFRRKFHVNVGGPMNILQGRPAEEITESFHETMKNLFERK